MGTELVRHKIGNKAKVGIKIIIIVVVVVVGGKKKKKIELELQDFHFLLPSCF